MFHIRLSGPLGAGALVIESSTNLVQWQPVATNVLELAVPTGTNGACFYRAVVTP
jgi:hypothetical protein